MGMATIPAISEQMKDFMDQSLKDCPQFILNCPISFQWVEFKGETMFAGINYDRSVKVGRPMIDLHYCATTACNGVVLKTVQYDKKKFKESHLNERK